MTSEDWSLLSTIALCNAWEKTVKPLSRIWWVLLLRGIVAVLFGLAAFAWPHHTLIALAYLVGVYVFADGLFALWTAFHCIEQKSLMRSHLLEGIMGVGMGMLTLIDPQWIVTLGLYLIAAWALCTGLFEIFSAREIYRDLPKDWHLGLIGFLSLLCGVFILVFPHQSKEFFVWLVGGYALVSGLVLLLFAFRLRGRHHRMETTQVINSRTDKE